MELAAENATVAVVYPKVLIAGCASRNIRAQAFVPVFVYTDIQS